MNECWNLRPQRHVNQIENNKNRPWQEERTSSGSNSNYNPRIVFNKCLVPINFLTILVGGKTNNTDHYTIPLHEIITQIPMIGGRFQSVLNAKNWDTMLMSVLIKSYLKIGPY